MFLDGILMDIMIDNGEIWCKLSALVMVYIQWRTPTFHSEWVFNPPAPPLRQNSVWTALMLRRGFPDWQRSLILIWWPLANIEGYAQKKHFSESINISKKKSNLWHFIHWKIHQIWWKIIYQKRWKFSWINKNFYK